MLALDRSQLAQLLSTADSFRFGAHSDYLRECQNRSHKSKVLFVGIHRAHQIAIDLDCVDWQAVQINERRITGAEVVEINLRSKLLDLTEQRHRRVAFVDQRSFGDLEAVTARRNSAPATHVCT